MVSGETKQHTITGLGLCYAFASWVTFFLFTPPPPQDRSSTPDVIVLGAAAVCLFKK